MNNDVLLACQDLSVGYGGHAVAEGITLAIHPGEYWCVAGANGSGKSTLLRTMLGLLAPIAGAVTHGRELRGGDIGFLPQRSDVPRDFPASVAEVVESGLVAGAGWRPFWRRAERERARAMMARMGIADLAWRSFRALSGGQQQRALLARALCAARRMLFLDEPVAGLDADATREMYELVRQLNQEDGVAVVMVSHDLDTAGREASHVLRLAGTDSRCDAPADAAHAHGGHGATRPLYCGAVGPLHPPPRHAAHAHGHAHDDGGAR